MRADLSKSTVAVAGAHGVPLLKCRFDPGGAFVFASAEDGSTQRIHLADKSKVGFVGHEGWTWGLAFLAGGKTLLTAGSDGRVRWWPALDPAPKPTRAIDAHAGWARALAARPDGALFATGGNDGLVKVWDVEGKPVRTLAGHPGRVYSVAWLADGTLASGDQLGHVRHWDLKSDKPVAEFRVTELHHANPAGQGVDFGGVRWITRSAAGVWTLAGVHQPSNPFGAIFEPLITLVHPTDRKVIRKHVAPGIVGSAWRCLYLADGTLAMVAGGQAGGFLAFFKPDQEKDIARVNLGNLARDMDLHPDGKRIVTCHHDGQIRITTLA
jgi:WD40 repeat protein